jgi:hypothetical protein
VWGATLEPCKATSKEKSLMTAVFARNGHIKEINAKYHFKYRLRIVWTGM